MELPRDQSPYWDRVAATKTFTHPWNARLAGRLFDRVGGRPRVLDLGCGNGRVLEELARHHEVDAVGTDFARGMLDAARSRGVNGPLVRARATRTPFADASFDLVILFSVLTCLPRPDDQAAVFAEARRVLRPAGHLYVSDLLRQEDERNRARYAEGARRYGAEDVFDLGEGVVLTHPTRARLDGLLAPFEAVTFEPLEVFTMNGHAAQAFQAVVRRGA